EASSEVIQTEWGDGGGVELTRVKKAVAEVFVQRSAKVIAAGLGDHAHLAAGGASDIGCVYRRRSFELGDPLPGELQAGSILHVLMIDAGRIHAVETEVVIFLRQAGKANAVLCAGSRTDRAGDEGHQTRPVAAVYR